MGNGCASCNIEEENKIKGKLIKINKNKLNMNKRLIDIDLISKFLCKIDFNFAKELTIGPYFLNEFEICNEKFYLDFLKKIKYLKYNNLTTPDENSKSFDLDLNYFYSLKNLTEIQWNYFINDDKFHEMLNLFVKKPNQQMRILIYFIVLSSKNELYKVYKPCDSTKDLLLVNKIVNTVNYDENLERVINCDIPRTFPRQLIMKEKKFTETLKQALLEITVIDKELGYVQGINNIVGYCLMLAGNNKEICITLFFSIMNMTSKLTGNKFRGNFTFYLKAFFSIKLNFKLFFMFNYSNTLLNQI